MCVCHLILKSFPCTRFPAPVRRRGKCPLSFHLIEKLVKRLGSLGCRPFAGESNGNSQSIRNLFTPSRGLIQGTANGRVTYCHSNMLYLVTWRICCGQVIRRSEGGYDCSQDAVHLQVTAKESSRPQVPRSMKQKYYVSCTPARILAKMGVGF